MERLAVRLNNGPVLIQAEVWSIAQIVLSLVTSVPDHKDDLFAFPVFWRVMEMIHCSCGDRCP